MHRFFTTTRLHTILAILFAALFLPACASMPGASPTTTSVETIPITPPPTAPPTLTPEPTIQPADPPPPLPTATPEQTAIGLENIGLLAPDQIFGEGSISRITLSPDGTTLAAAGTRSIWLIDKLSFEVLGKITAHGGDVTDVAWSPDGNQLASAGADGTVRIWDLSQLRSQFQEPAVQQALLLGHTSTVNSVAWSPDGTWIASGSEDQKLYIWNAASYQNEYSLSFTSPVYSLDWHPEEPWLLIGEFDGSLTISNIKTSETPLSFPAHDGWINQAIWSIDGQTVISGGLDKRVKVWDLRIPVTGLIELEERLVIETLYVIESAQWSPDGDFIAVAGGNPHSIEFYAAEDLESSEESVRAGFELTGHTSSVKSIAFAPGGLLISASQDNSLRAWNLRTRHEIRRFTPGGGSLLSSSLTSVQWSPDGGMIAAGGSDGSLIVWNPRENKKTAQFEAHIGIVQTIDWSPSGRWIASGGNDNFTRIWDVETGEMVQEFRSEGGIVNAVAFAPFGNQLASGGFFRIIQVWQAGTDQSPLLLYPEIEITALSWSDSGTFLTAGGSDGSVHLFEMPSATEIGILTKEHNTPIEAVVWEPSGGKIAAIDRGGTIAIWDSSTGQTLQRFNAARGSWAALSWSPRGIIAAAGTDGTILFFDSNTLIPVALHAGHSSKINAIDFSEDSRALGSVDSSGALKTWSIPDGEIQEKLITRPEPGKPGALPDFSWPPGLSIVANLVDHLDQLAFLGTGTVHSQDQRAGYLAIAGGTGAWIYDQETRLPVRYLEGGASYSTRWSPDGNYLAVRELQLTRIWDVEKSELLFAIPSGLGFHDALAWSPDSTLFAIGDERGNVQVHSIFTGEVVRSWAVESAIFDLAWGAKGKTLAASSGNEIWLWDLAAGDPIARLSGHENLVRSIAFHPSERLLLSGSDDQTIRIWNLETVTPPSIPAEGQEITWPQIKHDTLTNEAVQDLRKIAWSSDGIKFFALNDCCVVFEWGLTTREIQNVFSQSSEDTVQEIWLLSNGTVYPALASAEKYFGEILSGHWLSADHLLALGSNSLSRITLNDPDLPVKTQVFEKNLSAAAPDSLSANIMLRFIDGQTAFWNSDTGDLLNLTTTEEVQSESPDWKVKQAPNNTTFAWNSSNGITQTLQIYDPISHERRSIIVRSAGFYGDNAPETPEVVDFAWSPDGLRIAAALKDGTLSVMDSSNGLKIYEVKMYTQRLNSVSWSPDGLWIAVAGSDGPDNGGLQFVRILQASTGTPQRELALEFGRTPNILGFSPDSSLVATGDSRGGITIWQTANGEHLAFLKGHKLRITALEFSTNGSALLSTSRDGSIRLWGIPVESEQ